MLPGDNHSPIPGDRHIALPAVVAWAPGDHQVRVLMAAAGVDPHVPAHKGVLTHRRGWVAHCDQAVGAHLLNQDGLREREYQTSAVQGEAVALCVLVRPACRSQTED